MKHFFFKTLACACLVTFLLGSCKKKSNDAKPTPVATPEPTTVKDEIRGIMYNLNLNRSRLSNKSKADTAVEYYSQQDGSKKIEVSIWVSRSNPNYSNQVACKVDNGYVCIGGGAWADYGTGNGAFLTESRPLSDALDTWVASSRDHTYSTLHTLNVYAIGIKIKGIDPNLLKSYFSLKTSISATKVNHPTNTTTVTKGYKLVGGGARVISSGIGNLLFENYPLNDSTWKATSKDHLTADLGTIETFAIGLQTTIPNLGTLEIVRQSVTGTEVTSGPSSLNLTIPTGYALTCPGAYTTKTSIYGRLLTGISPNENAPRTLIARSKDHGISASDGGTLYQFALRIRVKP